MEFLKDLFGGGPLTYDQLAAAAKEKGYQVVNAAAGAYVSKADADNLQGQVTTLTGQLADANKKLEGYDPTWKAKAEEAQRKLEAQQFDFALEKGVAASGPRNAKAVMAMLDREKLSFAGGEIIGLEKQLEALKKGKVVGREDKSQSRHQPGADPGKPGFGTQPCCPVLPGV